MLPMELHYKHEPASSLRGSLSDKVVKLLFNFFN